MKRLWYSNNTNPYSPDNIHQVLMFGTLKEIRFLKEKFSEAKIKRLFINNPKKIYTAPAFNFIRKFILHINTSINEQKYLKYTPRNIG